ncbi:MAG: hypothetical protein LBR53_10325 [Deltaproteobacteria bacterium]|jgi:hypothetical protein|nr:hypothetical protein [Deltaproteobacteria bacterium]
MSVLLREHLPLALLSLFLATTLWLVISGQDMTTHDVTATLALSGLPKNLTVGQDIPEDVSIRLEANTAQFKLMDGRKLNLKVDASEVAPGPNILTVDVAKLDPPLPRGIKVVRVIPEEIAFEVYPFVTRELPVKSVEAGSLPAYLERAGPAEIDPPTARVTGPEQRMNSLTEVPTTPIVLSSIQNNENRVLVQPALPGIGSWFSVEPGEFKAHVPVSIKTGSRTFTVPITRVGEPNMGPGLPVAVVPKEAKVTVTWRMDRPQPPQAKDVSIQIFLHSQDLSRTAPTKVPLKAETVPGVTVAAIDPPEAEAVWLNSGNFSRYPN